MKLSDADIDNLLTDLSSSNIEKREKAERFYNENKAVILPQFFACLDKAMRYVEANKKWIVQFGSFSLVLGVVGLIMVLLSTNMPLKPYFVLSLPSGLIVIYIAISMINC